MDTKEITIEQKKKIVEFFGVVNTSFGFCVLLNYCQRILYPKTVYQISQFELRTLAHPDSKKRYKTFTIRKKNGGTRTIHAPKPELKMVLRCINLILQCVYTVHENANGFVEGKSVVDNAKLHCNNNYIFNIDLKDFFPSIEIGRVLNRLSYPPFNFKKEKGTEEIGNYIAWLACENTLVERELDGNIIKTVKRVLPQGSPTSPILSNIICERLDRRLTGLANRFGLRYSRYADDVTFSSMHNVYQKDGEFRKEMERIISEQYFTINQSKVRLQKSIMRQEVTGITVNKQVNVSQKYIKQLRMWLYYWESYGTVKGLSLFLQSYIKDKSHVKKVVPTPEFMEAVIGGKLNYLSMVKGTENSTYLKLKERFDKLSSNYVDIDNILSVWEENGIDEAINLYSKTV
ncbi:reverse transcriptase family protein [Chryseobacterium oryzae]|uniref:RNA-directed DNA polymerase n=1 Tax=Chryseobacterium oryzae TaxID=2929799 RepID=A0ABY4BKI3_9FLAO|nr:reverse transcriptase family protein [Chryseobacterium oryzae]UOE39708.1 reverse transcriptase family protein [Chryseobacterium oryzae]